MGNITNDGSRTYGWVEGRNLRQINLSDGRVVKCYDYEGTRYRRDVVSADGSSTYSYYYTYHGKKLMHLSNMHFFYDAQGKPCQVNRGGTIYNYVLNVQGDVVGLTDASGNLVVEYKYDAWGKLLGISGSLATSLGTANPLRYRGYVYDTETGLYYLHSRYYNPEMRRFVSVDIFLGFQSSILSHNIYSKERTCLKNTQKLF